jgi:DNA polymerase-3 subunit beta
LAKARYIVPTKVVRVLLSALNNAEGDVAATFGTNMAEFSSDQWTVSGKLIDGNYPNYRQVIPNNSKPLTTNREALIQVVKRAQLFTDERHNSVNLISDGKSIEVYGGNAERDSRDSLDAEGRHSGRASTLTIS